MNQLERRIIDIAYKQKRSHIGSALTALPAINACYGRMKERDKFVLSAGHAFLALAVVLEKYRGLDAEALCLEHGTHPNRNEAEGIWVSTGSLGQGLPIAVGMALADRTRDIYCVISDGECAEGSIWEALRIAGEQHVTNLKVWLSANGYSAYGKVQTRSVWNRLNQFFLVEAVETDQRAYPECLRGLAGHYTILTDEQYQEITHAELA